MAAVGVGCLVVVERFRVVLGLGRRGQVCESCPTSLHRGQALSEPGHEAMTLNPSKSKNGAMERGLFSVSLRTKSQQFDWRGVFLYMCGAIASITPCAEKIERN